VILPFVLLAALAAPWGGKDGWTRLAVLVLRSTLCLLVLILLTNTTRFVNCCAGCASWVAADSGREPELPSTATFSCSATRS